MFTVREYHDMLLIYGETRGNSIQAARLFGERFPNRKSKNEDTGSVVPHVE